MTCDSGSHAERENERGSVEAEGWQSGGAAASPNLDSLDSPLTSPDEELMVARIINREMANGVDDWDRVAPSSQEFLRGVARAVLASLATRVEGELVEALCSDCPPADYSTDKTRCAPCPRRNSSPEAREVVR